MFHMFNFHVKIVFVALLALSIFVGSRSFAAESHIEASRAALSSAHAHAGM